MKSRVAKVLLRLLQDPADSLLFRYVAIKLLYVAFGLFGTFMFEFCAGAFRQFCLSGGVFDVL